MDPQDFPSQPQQISQASSETPSKSYLPFTIGGLLILLIVGVGGFYLGKTSTKPDITPTPINPQEKGCTMEAKICPDGSAVGRRGPNCEFALCPIQALSLTPTQIVQDETNNLKTYTNEEVGFTFKYPMTVVLSQDGLSDNGKQLILNISIKKISSLKDDSQWLDRSTALQDKESLSKGEYGKDLGAGKNWLKKVENLDKTNAKSYISLTGLTCDAVYFNWNLIFYKNDYQVTIILSGQKDMIMSENPQYFKKGKEGCGVDTMIWNDNIEKFIQNLTDENISVSVLNWSKAFDQILSTFKFLDEKQ